MNRMPTNDDNQPWRDSDVPPKGVTKGVRVRPDQVERIEKLRKKYPDLTWGSALKDGLDLFLDKMEKYD